MKMKTIDWEDAVEEFIVRKDMEPRKGAVVQALKLAKMLGSQEISGNPLRDRIVLDCELERIVLDTRYSYPAGGGPWNGLVCMMKVAIFTLDDYSCIYCGDPPVGFEHIVPKGKHKANPDIGRVTNLASGCYACNTAKGEKKLSKFITQMHNRGESKRLRRLADSWQKDQSEYAASLRRRADWIENFLSQERKTYEEIDAYVRGRIGTTSI